MDSEWGFLVDECVNPAVAYELDGERLRAEAVKDVLWMGADDVEDILRYATEEDLILVTSDIADFGKPDDAEHEGIVLIYDNELGSERITEGIRAIVEQYPSRDALRGYEKLDPWVSFRED